MKQRLALILALLMLCPTLLASCSGDTPSSGENDAPAAASGDQSSETTVAETDDPSADDLPEKDFGGKEFRIYGQNNDEANETIYVFSAEENGEVINDAVFTANRNVEERFNVDITMTGYQTQNNTSNNSIGNSILAGDDVFDMLSCHDRTMAQFSLAGMLLDVNELPYLNYDKPWWPNHSLKSLTIGGRMFLISSSLSYASIRASSMVYFNKEKFADYGIEAPYQVVRDGDWTLDYMTELVTNIYDDVNGNSQRDDDDFYGFTADSDAYRIIESFGVQSYRPDDEKILVVDTDNEKTHSFIEKYYKLCYETPGGRMVGNTSVPRQNFRDGKTMMYFGTLGNAIEVIRYGDVEFGYLPMPKLNETQDTYITGCNDVPHGVPITNKDHELTGFMIEAMSAEGYRVVTPAYFEVALKQKFTTDAESIEMLDIIAENRVLDFGYLYCGSNKLCRPVSYLLNPSNPSTDYASFYAANIAAEQANVDAIIEAFMNIH